MADDILSFLQQRSSAPRLTTPAPSADQLQAMFQAACRVPDHARLRPWRFLCVSGDRRAALGELMAECALANNPDINDMMLEKTRNGPLRAPVVVIVVASAKPHAKVPYCEQQWSAACAAYALVLAAEAEGFGGVWRTGELAFDRNLMTRLGLSAQEEIIGFIYLGTRQNECRSIPHVDLEEKVHYW